MSNIANNELTYASRKFAIYANIFTLNNNKPDVVASSQYIPLANISRLEISSSLTSPLLSGKLSFSISEYNPFQILLRELYVYLNLNIIEYSTKYFNNTDTSLASLPRVEFNHTFLIIKTEMEVINKKNIQYTIHFISSDIWNLENKIYVATQGKEDTIIKLMSTAFRTAGLTLNTDLLSNFSTDGGVNKSIVYTSTANDTLNTIITYLQKQLLNPHVLTDSSPITCESLVSYIYDHIKGIYQLWNLDCIYHALATATNNYNTNTDTNTIDTIIAPVGSSTPFISQYDPNIELCQYPSTSRLDTVQALANYKDYTFNFSTNTFNPITIENKVKENIVESQWLSLNSTDLGVCKAKYKSITNKDYPQTDLTLVLDSYHSPSDSQYSIYKNLINILLGNDTLLVKTTCKIDRYPGTILLLTIDETIPDVSPDDKTNYETNLQFTTRTKWQKLQSLNGFYAIIGNTMVFEYDQLTNLPMFRNYLHLNRPVNIN